MAIQNGFQSVQLTLGFRYVLFTFYFVICKFIVMFKVEPVGLGGTTNMPALALGISLGKMSQILTLLSLCFTLLVLLIRSIFWIVMSTNTIFKRSAAWSSW